MATDYKLLSDRELVLKACGGDQLAYRVIYEKYVKAVRSRVKGFFQWQADVDDVVSESFEKFFGKLDSYDPDRDILPWLFTIATRTALDRLEINQREDSKKEGYKVSGPDVSHEGGEGLTDVNPEDEVISDEVHERLMGFLEELPPRYKEVMEKYMIDELEYADIAKELGLELNTVRTRIRRGKALLAEMMLRGEEV